MSGFELPPLLGQQPGMTRMFGEAMAPRGGAVAPEGLVPGRQLPGGPIDGGPIEGGPVSGGPAFGGLLEQALQRVASLQDDVRTKTTELAMGRPVELHDLMMSMGKSEAAFNLMLEVRNKLVDAWEKISRSVV